MSRSDAGPQRRQTSPHRFVGPGEAEFADWCHRLGIQVSYEPYLYELAVVLEVDGEGRTQRRTRKGFAPDFLIHGTSLWPTLHVELTTTRKPWRKISRIRSTRDMYGIHTVLIIVDAREWQRLKREPERLKRLLIQAGRRAAQNPVTLNAA